MKLAIASWLRAPAALGLMFSLLGLSQTASWAKPKHVLVVTATRGFRHSSIPTAEKVLAELAQQSGAFTVDYARGGPDGKGDEDIKAKMSPEGLKQYDGVIFANTTGDLPIPDPQAFIDWIRSGKAFIGMHAAADTFHGFPSYREMLGAEFQEHHAQATVQCLNEDPKHPATKVLGPTWTVHDEMYLFKHFHRDQVHGLLWMDQHPNTGQPGDYPVSWCKQFGQGRVFYISLGHREDVWDPNWTDGSGRRENPPEVAQTYQKVILGGIEWALGLEKGDARPQSTRAKLSRAETQEGFRPLFDGVDVAGWHLRSPERPSWSAQNGMLVNTSAHHGDGSDLISDGKFKDFVVRYEYMIPKGANSGFYLRGRYEIQILDDNGEPLSPGSNGAIYSLQAPSQEVSRKPGQWQQVEATIRGNHITVVLNGVKIQDDFAATRPTGGQLDDQVDQPGPIMLQGDHGAVAFRNILIKPLD